MNLLQIANLEEGRYLIGRLGQKPVGRIVYISKNSFTEHLGGRYFRSTFFSRNPIERIFQPIFDKLRIADEYKELENKREAFLHYAGLYLKHNKYPKIYLTTSTFNSVAGANSPVDGTAFRTGVDQTFANIRAGAGNGSQTTFNEDLSNLLDASTTSNQFDGMERGFFAFDTSSIPDTDAISSATFSSYVTAIGTGLDHNSGLYLGTLASNANVANSDYEGTVSNTTKQSDTATATASIGTGAYYDQPLNATGIGNINKTGITVFSSRSTQDADSSAPAWVSGVSSGITIFWADKTTNIPKLVVEHAAPSTAIGPMLRMLMGVGI